LNTFNEPEHQDYWTCEIGKKSTQTITEAEFTSLKSDIGWNTIEDIIAESIVGLRKDNSPSVIGIFLTACYRHCKNSPAKNHLIEQCLEAPYVSIYEPLYRQRQLQEKDDRAWERKKEG